MNNPYRFYLVMPTFCKTVLGLSPGGIARLRDGGILSVLKRLLFRIIRLVMVVFWGGQRRWRGDDH